MPSGLGAVSVLRLPSHLVAIMGVNACSETLHTTTARMIGRVSRLFTSLIQPTYHVQGAYARKMLSRDHDERSTTFHHGKNIMAKRDYWDELAEGGLQIELYRVPGFAFGDEEGTVNKFIAASP
jgi:hypothetical protein